MLDHAAHKNALEINISSKLYEICDIKTRLFNLRCLGFPE